MTEKNTVISRVKRQWLIGFALVFAFQLIKIFFIDSPLLSRQNSSTETIVLSLIFGLIISCCVFYITYYCAYKRNGTQLLLFQMIYGPLWATAQLSTVWKNSQDLGDFLNVTVLIISMFTYLWITSYKLYVLNSAKE